MIVSDETKYNDEVRLCLRIIKMGKTDPRSEENVILLALAAVLSRYVPTDRERLADKYAKEAVRMAADLAGEDTWFPENVEASLASLPPDEDERLN